MLDKICNIRSLIRHTTRLGKKRPYTKKHPYHLSHFDPDLLIRAKLFARGKGIYVWEAIRYLLLSGFENERKKSKRSVTDKLRDEMRLIQEFIAEEEKVDDSDTEPTKPPGK